MANDLKGGKAKKSKADVTEHEVLDGVPGAEEAVEAQKEHDRIHHGDGDTAGKPSVPGPDPVPGKIPGLVARPEPYVKTPDEVTKDSSADGRNAPSVPVLGWVDHDIPTVTGEVMHVHSPGVVLIRHHKADDKDQAE